MGDWQDVHVGLRMFPNPPNPSGSFNHKFEFRVFHGAYDHTGLLISEHQILTLGYQ